jgi:hypothetical protein
MHRVASGILEAREMAAWLPSSRIEVDEHGNVTITAILLPPVERVAVSASFKL